MSDSTNCRSEPRVKNLSVFLKKVVNQKDGWAGGGGGDGGGGGKEEEEEKYNTHEDMEVEVEVDTADETASEVNYMIYI